MRIFFLNHGITESNLYNFPLSKKNKKNENLHIPPEISKNLRELNYCITEIQWIKIFL